MEIGIIFLPPFFFLTRDLNKTCLCFACVHSWYLRRTEKSIWALGLELWVLLNCQMGIVNRMPDPLEKPALLTAKPLLQPQDPRLLPHPTPPCMHLQTCSVCWDWVSLCIIGWPVITYVAWMALDLYKPPDSTSPVAMNTDLRASIHGSKFYNIMG